MARDANEPGESWEARPAAALSVRGAILAIPIAAGVAAAVVVTRAMPRPTTMGGLIVLWILGFGVSSLVLFGVTRQARRFLPLAALLELSLTFPDHTPSRLGVALRSGNLRSTTKHRAALRATAGADRGEAIEAVLALAAALSAHDRATRGHSERVRALSELLCEEMHVPPDDRVRLRWASLLHDVGKMAVPAELLNKTGKLDDNDWETLRRHPSEGAKLTASLKPWLGGWSAAIEHHHERWDGGGYPKGLAGTDIHLGARIVAVADAYEVMTATRAYKKPISGAEARRRLAADAGRQFDPDVVRAFLNISLGRLRLAAGPVTWLAQSPFLRPAAVLARGPAPIALGGALAAAVVAISLPNIEPVSNPPAVAIASRATTPQVALEISRSAEPAPPAPVVAPPAVLAAVVTAPFSSSGPPKTQGAPPPLATVGPPASEPVPAPPPPGDPVVPTPAPEPQPQPAPTPLVLVSVRVGEPVDAGVAVGAGDPSAVPLPPVHASLDVG